MARGGPGVAWRVREFVDRSARQSPARLALGVFAAVIAVFTALPVRPVGHRRAGSGRRSSTRSSPRRPPVRVTGLVVVPTGDVLVDLRAWSSSSSPSRSAASA